MKCLFAGFSTIDRINDKHYPGGAAASLALNASLIGIESHLLSVLSDDYLGTWYKEILNKNKVLFPYSILNAPSIPTCIIPTHQHNGSEREWKDNGALPFFNSIKVPQEYIDMFDLIFIVNAPVSLAKNISLLLRKRNCMYIPGPQIVTDPQKLLPSMFNNTLQLFCNEEEWTIIEKTKDSLYQIPVIVITKGGEGGNVLIADGMDIVFKAPEVQNVIDTTGAGDNFALHFALSYYENESVPDAIEAGKKAAVEILKKYGNVHSKVLT